MSPTLNRSLAIWHFELSNAIKLHVCMCVCGWGELRMRYISGVWKYFVTCRNGDITTNRANFLLIKLLQNRCAV